MAKKILVFSQAYYPNHVGGAEVAVKEITDRISPEDFEFHILTLGSPGQPQYEMMGNAHVHRVNGFSDAKSSLNGNFSSWSKYIYIPLAVISALSLHRKHRFDAIWSIMASYAGFAAVMFAIIQPKIPFILTLQEGDPIPHIIRRARPAWPLFKQIFKRAAIIQAISTYLANFAKDMGATCPTVVVPNAVSVAQFSRRGSDGKKDDSKDSSVAIDAVLAELMAKKPGDTILITTGRLVHKNAVDSVIESLTLLPSSVRFVVLGIGELEQQLKEKAKALGVEERVTFGGFVNHADMPAYLHQADIFIRPSRSEGFGNSFIEAMAAEIPVIATPVGGIVDFLEHKKTGLMCDVDSPASIAEQVTLMTSDAELRANVISNAFAMVKEKYDWAIISKDMQERVFKKVV